MINFQVYNYTNVLFFDIHKYIYTKYNLQYIRPWQFHLIVMINEKPPRHHFKYTNIQILKYTNTYIQNTIYNTSGLGNFTWWLMKSLRGIISRPDVKCRLARPLKRSYNTDDGSSLQVIIYSLQITICKCEHNVCLDSPNFNFLMFFLKNYWKPALLSFFPF